MIPARGSRYGCGVAGLPGADLVDAGLRDLAEGRLSDEALLVLLAAPRLARAGIPVPAAPPGLDPSHALYESLQAALGDRAHGRHHALQRRIVSYARARAAAG